MCIKLSFNLLTVLKCYSLVHKRVNYSSGSERTLSKTTRQENLSVSHKHKSCNTQSYVTMSTQCCLPCKQIHSKICAKSPLKRMRTYQNVLLQYIFLQDMI